jgi:hypothetical protein
MIAVATAFAIVLKLGPIVHQKYPALPDLTLGAILAGAIACVAFGILYLLLWALELTGLRQREVGGEILGEETFGSYVSYRKVKRRIAKLAAYPELQARRQAAKEQSLAQAADYRKAQRLRIAELAADPARRKYAVLMERGGWWTDEQIVYHENPDTTATCPHLQPIEHAMRLAGIELRRLAEPWNPVPLAKVRADCCINEPALKQRFPFHESVRYTTGYQPERHPEDNPWAELACATCTSTIELVHPEWPRPTTKWFPEE